LVLQIFFGVERRFAREGRKEIRFLEDLAAPCERMACRELDHLFALGC